MWGATGFHFWSAPFPLYLLPLKTTASLFLSLLCKSYAEINLIKITSTSGHHNSTKHQIRSECIEHTLNLSLFHWFFTTSSVVFQWILTSFPASLWPQTNKLLLSENIYKTFSESSSSAFLYSKELRSACGNEPHRIWCFEHIRFVVLNRTPTAAVREAYQTCKTQPKCHFCVT